MRGVRRSLLLALLCSATAACELDRRDTPGADIAFPIRAEAVALHGRWSWQLVSQASGAIASNDGTDRAAEPAPADVLETEDWRLGPTPSGGLTGAYVRTVLVSSTTGEPFRCNQRTWYTARSRYEVTGELAPTGITLRELRVDTEPSPCDAGFRALASYHAHLDHGLLALTGDAGEQTLWPTAWSDGAAADTGGPQPGTPPPWATPAADDLAGTWRWRAASVAADGGTRRESEAWTIAADPADAMRLTGSYQRWVDSSADPSERGPCATPGATRHDEVRFYAVRDADSGRWRIREDASDRQPGSCATADEQRMLDDGLAERVGDFIVIHWRGNRRQVLYAADRELPWSEEEHRGAESQSTQRPGVGSPRSQ